MNSNFLSFSAVYSCTMQVNTAPSVNAYEETTSVGRLYRTSEFWLIEMKD